MDYARILAELRQEREQIEEAIVSLERLARARDPKRGSPPAGMSAVSCQRHGRSPGSKNKIRNGGSASWVEALLFGSNDVYEISWNNFRGLLSSSDKRTPWDLNEPIFCGAR
jgi:hypothetical protein